VTERVVPWLEADEGPSALPDPADALRYPNGLLAAGGALTPEWLLGGYRRGIFPWYSDGDPILWWSPDPRAVFDPLTFTPSKSLRQSIRNRGYETRKNTAFSEVIRACAAPRAYADGTWITEEMIAAYETLHRLGHAHSYETWAADTLVGGLYGVRVGRVFFGESMFSQARDASKVALARLMADARHVGIALVDCQMPTPHLDSLGALTLPRADFMRRLEPLVQTDFAGSLRE
jgi:leucyl/phenylalanyl-tRNA--protein transferase